MSHAAYALRTLTACSLFERSGMVLMSHNREASKVTVNSSYFHPAHQHYTDEAHKAETVRAIGLSVRAIGLNERATGLSFLLMSSVTLLK